MKRPNLFLVGQPRTGTSALHNVLNQHPDIFMSIPKEPVYFAKDLHAESDAFHKRPKFFHFREESQYLNIFNTIGQQKIAGESTAVYLYSKTAARDIHRFNPDAKIIMMFREPVSWLGSYHAKACQILGEDQRNLSEALKLEVERKKGRFLSKDVMAPSLLFYTEFLKFRRQIERYTQLFSPANIKTIIYDDYKRDNPKIVDEVFRFLDVDTEFVPQFMELNASKSSARWPVIQRIIQFPYLIKFALKLLPRNIFGKFSLYYWEYFFKANEEKKIDPQLRKSLMQNFRPEVEQLSDLLRRNLIELWGYNKT